MINSYDEACQYLTEASWVKRNPGLFVKGDLELVWDTTSYVEVYEDRIRIAEGRINSAEDMKSFIELNGLM